MYLARARRIFFSFCLPAFSVRTLRFFRTDFLLKARIVRACFGTMRKRILASPRAEGKIRLLYVSYFFIFIYLSI